MGPVGDALNKKGRQGGEDSGEEGCVLGPPRGACVRGHTVSPQDTDPYPGGICRCPQDAPHVPGRQLAFSDRGCEKNNAVPGLQPRSRTELETERGRGRRPGLRPILSEYVVNYSS